MSLQARSIYAVPESTAQVARSIFPDASPVIRMHDVTQLDAVLAGVMVRRKTPPERRSKHLCADAGYWGQAALKVIESYGYIAHVVSRHKEAGAKRRDPTRKARRWVVEVCHSWFSRFPKLQVRSEKIERSFLAFNHLAAASIALRRVKLNVYIIYG